MSHDSAAPAWLAELTAYVSDLMPGERVLPERHPHAPYVNGIGVYPHVLACPQCGEECRTMCLICFGGLHDFPCTDYHATGQCEGEDHRPTWMIGDGTVYPPIDWGYDG